MAATLLPNGKQQFIDINGAPLVAGTVGMYIPSTLTPKATWKDAGESILNTNPIVLDSRGQCIIYGDGTYRQIVKDSLGNLIWDEPTTETIDPNAAVFPTATGNTVGNIVTMENTTTSIQDSGQPITGATSWTPIDTSGAGLSFANVSASYTRIGNIVFVYGVLTYPATGDGSNAQIGGLPVTVANQNYSDGITQYGFTGAFTYPLLLQPAKGTAHFNIFMTGTSFAQATNTDLSGAIIEFSFWYPVL